MSLPVSVLGPHGALPRAGEAWGLATACFKGESRYPPWGAQTRLQGPEGCLILKSMSRGCRTGCCVYLMSLLGCGRSWLPVWSDLSPSPLSSWWCTPLTDTSSMEMGSVLMLLRLMSIQDGSYPVVVHSADLSQLVASGCGSLLLIFLSSSPSSAHPFSSLGQQTQSTGASLSPAAVSWLSHGHSKGHFGFRPYSMEGGSCAWTVSSAAVPLQMPRRRVN